MPFYRSLPDLLDLLELTGSYLIFWILLDLLDLTGSFGSYWILLDLTGSYRTLFLRL